MILHASIVLASLCAAAPAAHAQDPGGSERPKPQAARPAGSEKETTRQAAKADATGAEKGTGGKEQAAEQASGATAPSDPFEIDEALRRLLEGPDSDYEPLAEQPLLPAMRLKGVLGLHGKQLVALVEIDGVGTFLAREGGRILFTIQGRVVAREERREDAPVTGGPPPRRRLRSLPIALLVREVTPEAVVVEVGTLGQTLVIR